MSESSDNFSSHSGQPRPTTPSHPAFQPGRHTTHSPGYSYDHQRAYAQNLWNKGPTMPPNYDTPQRHTNGRRSSDDEYGSAESRRKRHKNKHSYSTHSSETPLYRRYSNDLRYRTNHFERRSDKNGGRQWIPSPPYRQDLQKSQQELDATTHRYPHVGSSQARVVPTQPQAYFDPPSHSHYLDGSQPFDAVYNEQYMNHRDRWERDNVTILDLTPSLSNEEVSKRPSGGLMLILSVKMSAKTRQRCRFSQAIPRRPMVSLLWTQKRWCLHIDREAFSGSRSEQQPVDNSRARVNEDQSVNAGHISETRSLAEDHHWEDDYDQSSENESLPRQESRHILNPRTNDEVCISLGPEEDELTKNHWA
ncbi:hypothetical protein CPB84DRAFT_740721 [Gymnopilus junonius]|uniref:Uncharacterized protein n=1 Tax=Gymnopilus junonius TaxID=109634 RepID=A0A9P5NXG6_GYMJU|nr:hypothetical protein CPB84DRAFT_740721 [Gymnopilus junonius]